MSFNRFAISFGKCIWTALMMIAMAASAAIAAYAQQKPEEATLPEKGKSIERELKGDESHICAIKLEAGQYFRAAVMQKGIDVTAVVYDPDGKKVYDLDLWGTKLVVLSACAS